MFWEPMSNANTVSARCLITAQLYGDEYELKFWTVFEHYLQLNQSMQGGGNKAASDTASEGGGGGAKLPVDVRQVGLADAALGARAGGAASMNTSAGVAAAVAVVAVGAPILIGGETILPRAVPKEERLPACFGVLCDAEELRLQQLDSLAVHKARKLEVTEARHITERHVLLGQHTQAVQMLLETDAKEESFYADSLRACVIAAVRTPATAQNTIKLVAMNLIAAGKLDEGVELLCLVGCHLDACYYLQSEGLWRRAALLSKATLHYAAYSEVLSRWVDHLSSSSRNAEAVLVCLTFGRWMKALELLYELKWASLSALFADACVENELLQQTDLKVAVQFELVWTRAAEWAKKTLGDDALATKYAELAEQSRLAVEKAQAEAKIAEAAEAAEDAVVAAAAAAAEAAELEAVAAVVALAATGT
jgi:hypothetical protein